MSDLSEFTAAACCASLERVRYFPRQLLTADDLSAEQEYVREKLRRHNRMLHGFGVVCGCAVDTVEGAAWTVRVNPGYAVSPQGDEIQICEPVEVDLRIGTQSAPCTVQSPCPPVGTPAPDADGRLIAYIAVRYVDCPARPVRVHPSGCGCDESACEYSRVRESLEIMVLWQLPESHRQAAEDDARWVEQLRKLTGDKLPALSQFPVPDCPRPNSDPWVVLATVGVQRKPTLVPVPSPQPAPFPASGAQPVANVAAATAAGTGLTVSYKDRRVLLSTQRMQVAMLALQA